uniref:DNA topoisomerase n=1 Tax=Mimiviridae sp. ChoanoV1 TaxID=2596887 RepID=A0A5B8IE42_9VIRU|nr:DNA topoisomerase [Mimiviridae sp. ChoanoV1]
MTKSLLVCESPAKIKYFEQYLGKDFIVKACFGHFRDLPKKQLSIDIDNNFKPKYISNPDKTKVISELKKEMKKCKNLYIASDYDREGEAIGWHLIQILKSKPENTKRIIFTEITKSAIQNAVKNPTKIDINMFYAQQARRILDRLIGYLISPILWKQIQSSYKEKQSLSAGRVQSVVVKLITEREKDIKEFESEPYFKVAGSFELPLDDKTLTLNAELNKDIPKKKVLDDYFKKSATGEFYIHSVKTKKTKRKPPEPFITSTLQQEASNKLGMSPKTTMSLAQELYEKGKITYMRTDLKRLSEEAKYKIKEKVEKEFGLNYYQDNKVKTKSDNTQEAHEACRPTNFDEFTLEENPNISSRANRLYKLIWTRTMMSQMKPADVEVTNIKIYLKNGSNIEKYHFVSKKEFIIFDGFLILNNYNKFSSEEEDEIKEKKEIIATQDDLKKIQEGLTLNYKNIIGNQKYSRHPQGRFTEASLIKKLDDLGIGRPSTYATMISNVQDRKYVEKKTLEGEEKECLKIELFEDKNINETKTKIKIGVEKNKLFPSDIGIIVTNFLEENFPNIMNYDFTAKIEEQLDQIAEGKKNWEDTVNEVFMRIKPKLDELNINPTQEKDKFKRKLGICPNTNLEVHTYIGKYGPLVHLKDPDGKKNKFSPLKDIKIEEVTLEQALELLKFPLKLGKLDRKEIQLCKGQYGFYIKYDKKNYSVDKEVSLEEAKEVIKNLSTGESENQNTNDLSVEIKTGKFGPYFTKDGKNYSIFKTYDVNNLTKKDIEKIITDKKKYESDKRKK